MRADPTAARWAECLAALKVALSAPLTAALRAAQRAGTMAESKVLLKADHWDEY